MFSRKHRISKKKEIDNIFKKGKTINSGFFKIFYLNNNLLYNRFTIIINKKVSKSAFFRNKLKRLLRKNIEKHFIKNKGNDFIFLVFPNIKENIENLENEIEKVFYKNFNN